MASVEGVDKLVRRLRSMTPGGQKKATGSCGYSADYSQYVHEDLTKVHGESFNQKYALEIASGIEHARRPQEQAKFLDQPLQDYRQQIADIIVTAMRNKEGIRVGVQRALNFLMAKSAEIIPIDTGYLLSTAWTRVQVS